VNQITDFWSSGANEDLNCSSSNIVWCESNGIEVRKEDIKMNLINTVSSTERCLALRLDGSGFSLQYANCGSSKLGFICEVRIRVEK
jgi:hypothetical protein